MYFEKWLRRASWVREGGLFPTSAAAGAAGATRNASAIHANETRPRHPTEANRLPQM